MRILLATDHYPPLIGGGQVQSRLLGQQLHARGHDVAVATVWQHAVSAFEVDAGVPVHRLRQLRTLPGVAGRWRHHQPPFPDPVTVVALRRLISSFRPDVVHSYGWFSYSCAVALAGRDIPLLLTSRDYAYNCPKRTLVRNGAICSGPGLAKCLACAGRDYGAAKGLTATIGVHAGAPLLRHKARGVHSVSTYVERVMARDFIRDARIRSFVVHDAFRTVPNDYYASPEGRAALARLDGLPGDPFMLFVGAFRRVKGIELLLEAYTRLTSPPPLVLIGTFERDSPREFPPGIHVLSDVPHEAVMRAWDRSLFAVLPSLLPEPFGTVVAEAMSRGKAVIGTVPGGHADAIVDGETGLLVPSGDVGALAEAMQTLVDDADLRARLGGAARERADLFTAERVTAQLEGVYEELLARS